MDFMLKLFKCARQRVHEYRLENGDIDQLRGSMEEGTDQNAVEVDGEGDGIGDDEELIALKRELSAKRELKEKLVAENQEMDSKLSAFSEEVEKSRKSIGEQEARMDELEKTKMERTPLEQAVYDEFVRQYHKIRGYTRGVFMFNKQLTVTAEGIKNQKATSKAEND